MNGTLTANGFDSGSYGCGAGGSIWIKTGRLAGTGMISARGGNQGTTTAYYGGGGRVAIYYSSTTFTGLPPEGSHLNKELSGYRVTVRGGTGNAFVDGPEDGSAVIQRLLTRGGLFIIR